MGKKLPYLTMLKPAGNVYELPGMVEALTKLEVPFELYVKDDGTSYLIINEKDGSKLEPWTDSMTGIKGRIIPVDPDKLSTGYPIVPVDENMLPRDLEDFSVRDST